VEAGTTARTSSTNAAFALSDRAPSQKPPLPYATACFSALPSASSRNSGTFTLPVTCT
jgi:hypothetical protein